jgi:DNA-binding transcriptional MerR regulator
MKRYTTEDVARAVDVQPSTIRAYHSRGQMPAPSGRVGSTPYWEPKDIEPWIKDRTKVTTP